MAMNYVYWKPKADDETARFESIEGDESSWRIMEGMSRIGDFPEDAVFRMNPEFPYGIALKDSVKNTSSMIVVSPPLKEFLEKREVNAVEYLPVGLLNHKGRPAQGGKYFIVNLLDPVDCLDLDRCDAKYSNITPEDIRRVKSLVLDEAKVDTERQLFSPKGLFAPLARRDLAEAIDAAGFTGIRWVELKDIRNLLG